MSVTTRNNGEETGLGQYFLEHWWTQQCQWELWIVSRTQCQVNTPVAQLQLCLSLQPDVFRDIKYLFQCYCLECHVRPPYLHNSSATVISRWWILLTNWILFPCLLCWIQEQLWSFRWAAQKEMPDDQQQMFENCIIVSCCLANRKAWVHKIFTGKTLWDGLKETSLEKRHKSPRQGTIMESYIQELALQKYWNNCIRSLHWRQQTSLTYPVISKI